MLNICKKVSLLQDSLSFVSGDFIYTFYNLDGFRGAKAS